MLNIDIETARRFILGKQGLWPGRHWRGIKGTEQAMRAMEYLQLDPLQIVARERNPMLDDKVILDRLQVLGVQRLGRPGPGGPSGPAAKPGPSRVP